MIVPTYIITDPTVPDMGGRGKLDTVPALALAPVMTSTAIHIQSVSLSS